MSDSDQAAARGVINGGERLYTSKDGTWAVNNNRPDQRRKLRDDWRSLPVTDTRWLISN